MSESFVALTPKEIEFIVSVFVEQREDVRRRQKKREKDLEEAKDNPDRQLFYKKAEQAHKIAEEELLLYDSVINKLTEKPSVC